MKERCYQLLALVMLASASCSAFAGSFIYEIRSAANESHDILRIDPTAGAFSTVYTNYPENPNNSYTSTLAQCPDGNIYYVIYETNGRVYKWNPATPLTAPAPLSNRIGNAVPGSYRLGCDQNGTLYYLPENGVVYTINTSSGVATNTGFTITGLSGVGGDMAFDSIGTLYVITSTRNFYRASIAGGNATLLGTVTGPAANTAGLAFVSNNAVYTLTSVANPPVLYQFSTTNLSASSTVTLTGQTGETYGDLASVALASPNIGVAKAFSPATILTNGTSTLTISLTNANARALSGAAFTDMYLSLNLRNAGAPTTTCGGTVTAISPVAPAAFHGVALSGGTIPAAGSCTVSITVTSAIANTYTNTLAAHAITTVLVYNDNPASATLTVLPLTVAKSTSVYSDPVNGTAANKKAIPGAIVEYTLIVTNPSATTANAVTVTDTIPANSTYLPGSMTLNAVPLTDVVDAPTPDAGSFTGTTVNVNADTITGPGGTATVKFRVTIN